MLINGIETDQIPASDRGFQYGDGLFETIPIEKGKPLFLLQHINRLKTGCQRLKIQFPGTELLVEEALRISNANFYEPAILKIIVTRGSGGRGYRCPEVLQSTRVFSLHPRPSFKMDFNTSGIRAVFCKSRLGINPSLAGLKHLNRLEQIVARAEWDDPNIQEGLMFDSEENLIEGTMTNLFIIKQNVLVTPDLSRCGVEGIIRSLVLEIAKLNGYIVRITQVGIDDIQNADEVFVTNSVVGIWPVVELENRTFHIGPVTQKIICGLEQKKATQI